MDERSQHGYPQQPPQSTAPEHAPMPQQAGASPWPNYAPPVPNAPIAGHAPYPGPAPQQHQQLPTMQQFQYAADGYVLPGAGQSQGSPMSAHGGTIGVAQPHHVPGMPMVNGGHQMQPHGLAQQHAQPQQFAQPQPQHFPQPHQQHAQPHAFGAGALAPHPMHDANGQPQSWAFPTPNGLQLVQPGTSSMAHPGAHAGMPGAATARRMRWETIVPILAVLCLVAAIGLFLHDFDRITGRDAKTAPSAETTTQADVAAPKAETPDVQATIDDANAKFQLGRFDEAANLLHPLLDVAKPDPAAVALHDKVDAASARNAALLKRLSGERAGKRWTAVIGTIGQIEKLRPLDRPLVSLRTRARAAVKAAKAARAKELAAQQAAAKLRAASPSTNGGGGHAGHAGHTMPPVAGGNTGSSSNVRPPANVPQGSIPTVPNVPNPAGSNPGVVGGGQAAETMCDVTRTPRHNGEDHGTC